MVVFLVTKLHPSDPYSLDHLESPLRKLVKLWNELRVKTLAFVKYERGLDKLWWIHASEFLNRSRIQFCERFTNSIKCTIYFNKTKSVEDSTDDLNINSKITKADTKIFLTMFTDIDKLLKPSFSDTGVFFTSNSIVELLIHLKYCVKLLISIVF